MSTASANCVWSPLGRVGRILATMCALFLCAATAMRAGDPEPLLDFDVELFKARVDDTLKIGIKLKDAKKIVREAFPPFVLATEIAPVIQSGKSKVENKRFMFAWTTTEPLKNLTLTLFFDREGKLARWTVGPMYGELS